MGQLLWAKLAEDLDIISGPDHGKIEGMCASDSLAACRCDLMTSDLMPSLRLAKVWSHSMERRNLLPLSGSSQGGVALSESRCRRLGAVKNTEQRPVASTRPMRYPVGLCPYL